MKKVQQWHALIEKQIKKTPFGKEPASLYEPIRYLMGLGGKRLRPLLVLMGYSLFRRDTSRVVSFAVAVEAFHNFTLMHDDIMDNAPLRRGHKTVHEKWNVNTAILSGDVLLVKVYQILGTLDADRLPAVLEAFNRCATEVCEGQQLDMDFENRDRVTEEEYIQMIRQKTAVLLGFSLELGGILGGASEAERKQLYEFGVNIGIGFQLKDDLLDAYGDPRVFGKQVGGDILANKKTYLLIKALELASPSQRSHLQHWLTARRFRKAEKISAVKSVYDTLNVPAYTKRKIDGYFNKGFRQLQKMHTTHDITLLEAFTRQLIDRQS